MPGPKVNVPRRTWAGVEVYAHHRGRTVAATVVRQAGDTLVLRDGAGRTARVLRKALIGVKTPMQSTRPDVAPGDEIFFHNDTREPCCGRVLCCGAHGATVDCDGARHPVRWAAILGHKARAERHYDVADEGEDGAILDGPGGRIFVKRDKPMKKSATPMLLIKANIKGKTGLVQKQITDKRGVTARRWVRSGKPIKVGDQAAFDTGHAKGEGVIHKLGNEHIVVRDPKGNTHRVHHRHVPGHVSSAEYKTHRIMSGLFTDDEKKADEKTHQPTENDAESVLAHARQALPKFKALLANVAEDIGAKVYDDDETWVRGLSDRGKPLVVIAPLKNLAPNTRGEKKVHDKYNGDWRRLRDVVRGTIAVDSAGDMPRVIEALREAGMKLAGAPDNKYSEPTNEGYRDISMNIELPGGHIAEMQVNTKKMLQAKEVAHPLYKQRRTLTAKIKEEEREATDAEDREIDRLMAEQGHIYGRAWDAMHNR